MMRASPLMRSGFFLCSLFLAACVNPQSGTSDFSSSWVRPEDPQEQIGQKEHPVIVAKYGGVYSNPKVEQALALVVSKLVAVSPDPSRVYKVTLLDTPKVNAFALPGGYLYVTRGLLALANDASEVAAVLAHEMAHVSADHAIIRQEKLSSIDLGEKIVSEVLTDSTAGKVAVAANRIRLSRFSQEQELQADAIGIRLAGNAGYDPFAAERFLNTMQRYRAFVAGSDELDGEENFASSHPSTPKRIELALRHARFFGAPGVGERDKERYFNGINGMMFGDSAEEGFVRGKTFSHAGLGVTFEAPDGFTIDNQPKAVLVSGPGDISTRFDATVVSNRTTPAEYLKSGWVTGLIDETIREETINGLRSASASATGDGWRFKVRVISNGSQLYRFITAAPQTNTSLDAVSRQIANSFRALSEREIANLKPLTIKVIPYGGQPIETFYRKMKGTDKPEALFRLLNGLSASDSLVAGQRVKIVTY